ncbi:cytochrome b [Pseudomonas sp. Teo4]|uniref:cytochrome b n=1 Tax=Pseudomonas sp. Teo4 TaxID=3064528 RepID=UPI002ABC8F20|nr:cytochrome b/b6 domain-containing protein [Pseudomonas sp. Teo4]MDZ3994225.1 Cytochrome b561 [Pseudomonas sp. Teo4]
MNDERYCWQQILLHWVSAALILWVLVSGFWIATLNVERSTHHFISTINVSLGTLYIPVFLVRWALRLNCVRPQGLHANARLRLMASTVHEGLYWVTAAVLLSGVLMIKRDVEVFGWFTLPVLVDDPLWLDIWFVLHRASCVLLALLLVMHVGAVIMHASQGRNVLRRMLL